MNSEYGHKLNPYRKLRKPFGVKGERLMITNSMDSDSIGPGRKITVKFPKLSDDDVIVPGTAKLSFKIDLKVVNTITFFPRWIFPSKL